MSSYEFQQKKRTDDLDRIESMQKQLEDSDSQNNVEAALKLRMREEPNFEYPNESTFFNPNFEYPNESTFFKVCNRILNFEECNHSAHNMEL